MTFQEKVIQSHNEIQNLNWDDLDSVNATLRNLFNFYHEDHQFPYERLLNQIQDLYSSRIREHFGQRMDNRTLGEFGLKIYSGHLRERRIANYWLPRYLNKHFGQVTGECVGIDDSGCLLLETVTKEVMKRPDYILTPGNTYMEIKSNPCDWKYTPKVADVRYYINVNAYTLAMSSNGPFVEDGSNAVCYFLISPEQSKRMLELSSVLRGRNETGGKPAIQFYWNKHPEAVDTLKRIGSIHRDALPLEEFCDVHWITEPCYTKN